MCRFCSIGVVMISYLQDFVVVFPFVVDGPHWKRIQVVEGNLKERERGREKECESGAN
jgi:hypothetical protein